MRNRENAPCPFAQHSKLGDKIGTRVTCFGSISKPKVLTMVTVQFLHVSYYRKLAMWYCKHTEPTTTNMT